MKLQEILVAHDFSPHARRALEYGIGLAEATGARVHVLHAYRVQPELVIPGDLWDRIEAAAARGLEEAAGVAGARGIDVETHLCSTHPVRAIRETAEKIGADLIVMGTRGLSGWRHVLIGSIAEAVVRVAPCPVLTVKADGSSSGSA